MSVHYNRGKANVIKDALSRLSMYSVAHVDEERKELFKDVHGISRLGICLMSISYNGVTIQNTEESSMVVEIKENHDSDQILLEIKRVKFIIREWGFSPKGEMVTLLPR